MEIKDLVQAIVGALVLKPDEALLTSALDNSVLFSRFGGAAGLGQSTVDALGIVHVLFLILGLGLLLGVGPVTSVTIALLVVLGVAGGLFAIGQFMNVFGPQVAAVSQGVNGVISSLVVQPYLADVYIFAPLLVLGAGVFRWRYSSRRTRRKTASATQALLRQHCTFCGARVGAASTRCRACGRAVSTKTGNFCCECGKPVPKDAAYCGYCGAEVLHGEEAKCQNCGRGVPGQSRYCLHCGARLRAAQPERKDEGGGAGEGVGPAGAQPGGGGGRTPDGGRPSEAG